MFRPLGKGSQRCLWEPMPSCVLFKLLSHFGALIACRVWRRVVGWRPSHKLAGRLSPGHWRDMGCRLKGEGGSTQLDVHCPLLFLRPRMPGQQHMLSICEHTFLSDLLLSEWGCRCFLAQGAPSWAAIMQDEVQLPVYSLTSFAQYLIPSERVLPGRKGSDSPIALIIAFARLFQGQLQAASIQTFHILPVLACYFNVTQCSLFIDPPWQLAWRV